jgi:hypothetical protein
MMRTSDPVLSLFLLAKLAYVAYMLPRRFAPDWFLFGNFRRFLWESQRERPAEQAGVGN